MHTEQRQWARSGPRFLQRVLDLINIHNPTSVLDYGCGKGALIGEINQHYPVLDTDLYDPAVPEFNHEPEPADMVLCTDVLEHIEPELIDNVLAHLNDLTHKVCYFVVHTGDCGHKLPDGRPAHILQKPETWWREQLIHHFPQFDFTFKDTGLPLRFEVIGVRHGAT